jgi:hypothetical protein
VNQYVVKNIMRFCFRIEGGFGFVVFNATFNNISVISWQSVLFVEETTSLSQVIDNFYHDDPTITTMKAPSRIEKTNSSIKRCVLKQNILMY